MPVLPLVESSRLFPGRNCPLLRASATMLEAARSFTEPPGLYHSALPNSATPGRSAVKASKRNSGVLPMRSTRLWPRVSPSPDTASRDSSCDGWIDMCAILLEPCAIFELNDRDLRNVLCSHKRGM